MPSLANYDNPTEEQECQALHQWLELKKIPHHHIANESRSGRYGAIRGKKLKAMGQSKGFPDYLIAIPTGKVNDPTERADNYNPHDVVLHHGALKRLAFQNRLVSIEMKRRKGGVLSPEQKEWLDVLTSCGIECAVCRGFDEAKKFIESRIK